MTRSRLDRGTLVEWQGVNLPLHFTPHFASLFLQVLLVLIFTPGQRKVLKGKNCFESKNRIGDQESELGERHVKSSLFVLFSKFSDFYDITVEL